MPATNLPGWTLALAENFDREAALGSFSSTYKGWAAYDGGSDTSGNGRYNSATTMSVHGGVLDEYLHTQNGQAQVAALTPTTDGKWGSQTYGRYAVRFKADKIPGYKVAWLLWPSSDNWAQGELDFPETDLNSSISGYAHNVTGTPSHNQWAVDTSADMSTWHTAVIEWAPGRVTYMLDGQSWSTTDTKAVPKDPMSWVLQTETQLAGGAPSSSASGHVSIDWVAAWRHV